MTPTPAKEIKRFADGRMADAEAFRQFLRDQMRPGPQPAVDHVGQQGLDDGLPPQAATAL